MFWLKLLLSIEGLKSVCIKMMQTKGSGYFFGFLQ
jgi:hypothetical protein